jgi:starch phosphorylase
MNRFLGTYHVIPYLPKELEKLREIAYNLIWSWNPDIRELFKRLDRDLWIETNHNPVMMLGLISQERLLEVSQDDGFRAHLDRGYNNLKQYLTEKTWFQKNYNYTDDLNIVYFSAEFGLTECLQTYSGGLGVLAGDHLKAASDLGIPLVGLGLLYKVGYFQQYLNSEGWQHERYEINDFDNLPMTLILNEKKEPLVLSVTMADREVYFQIWMIQIGRIPLYLLDTNVSENSELDRKITETLYGGNVETRIQQEIVLGIGGIKALQVLGIHPTVCHMNEGHSAFLSLERIRHLIQNHGLNFNEAKEVGFYSNVFTTHTPVPAGIDVFPNELVEKYLGTYYRNELKISDTEFYSLGSIYRHRESSVFNMAHLAMNTSGFINGVSKLHSEVSRKMWVSGYPNVPFNEIPIGHITNGIHTRSHISREFDDLFVQYIGEKWIRDPSSAALWERVDSIPDEEIWRLHERRRARLVAFVRKRLVKQIKSKGGSQVEIEAAGEILDPNALTIGFARRFATYKRATLIFQDLDRLLKILNHKEKPVQFVISGKAHPKDEEGKRFIQEIYQITKDERFKRKIVFIENYDLNVASYLVQGCDIWLNNPRRPLEASGTSGMKVIANGGLNLSVLDGWWAEAFDPEVGWEIGGGEEYSDPIHQDNMEARQLFNTIETKITPLFYARGEDRIPRAWIAVVKNSMRKLGPIFNTQRMVQEYFEKYYIPAHDRRGNLLMAEAAKVKDFTLWKKYLKENWSQIFVGKVETSNSAKQIFVGQEYPVKAEINLGQLKPEDVEVQIYFGPIEDQDSPQNYSTMMMAPSSGKNEDGNYIFSGVIKSRRSGQQGFTIRILPKNPLLISPFELGVVHWAS